MTTRVARGCCIVVLSPLLFAANAQVIRVKTIPVAESEQFSFMPSAGMASVSIALADTLLDPFINPAKGGRVRSSQYFGAPSFFTVSSNSGAGTTFPIGAILKRGSTFVSIAGALQEIHRADESTFQGPIPLDFAAGPTERAQSSTSRNNYTVALFGHTFDSARVSIGASALWSGLGAIDGVEQFYVNNDWLRQKGEAVDIRLGVVKEWAAGQSLEALVVRDRLGHSHDVGFTDRFWDPGTRQILGRPRTEANGEQTSTWGLQLGYELPLPVPDSGWRVGTTMTANRISHGRIPTYDVMRGLGTAGRSSAFNFGVGVARSHGSVAFGVDAIYEPITSTTWIADSVNNRFRFSNGKLRAGVSRTFALLDPGSSFSIQFGAEWYTNGYVMNQQDRISNVSSVRKERWLERTRTAGMSFRIPGVEVYYHVLTRTGLGRPGVFDVNNAPPVVRTATDFAPWMPPPVSATTLGPVHTTWHQFAISIPHR